MLVMHDELELNLGKWKHAGGGLSAKGQKGLLDIAAKTGKNEFHRLRIGISRPESRDPAVVSQYVLSKFDRQEQELLKEKLYPEVKQLLLSFRNN